MAEKFLTLGDAAQRIGHGCRRWMIQRIFERGILPQPKRIGLYRILSESDLGNIERVLREHGYLKEKPAAAK
jgi:hypothetical protein